MEVFKKGMEAKMDGLKKGVETKMDCMEAKMDGMESKMDGMEATMEDMNNGIKACMEGLKECLTKLLQEMLPNSEKVFHETHDEDKRNMNYDFIDSNVGFNTHYIPNIDMRKFDGKDSVA